MTTPTPPPPIPGAATSTAAVVGVHRGPRPSSPRRVDTFDGFLALLGPDPGPSAGALVAAPDGPLALAVRGFFDNGGTRLYVSLAGTDAEVPGLVAALPELEDVALIAAPGHTSQAAHDALVRAAARRPGLFALLDPPEALDAMELAEWARTMPTGAAAVYAPWLVVEGPDGGERTMPPSGHVMGVISRVSSERGVWIAPAGTGAEVRGIVRRAQPWGDADQALLHGVGINAIRSLPGVGDVVWGARTGGGVGPSRHLPTVRLLSWLARSLQVGTRWVAGRTHDAALWADVRACVEAFLGEVWAEGGLAGATASEAFQVRCGPATMTDDDVAAGRLVVLCGVAPARGGEFVTLRLLQLTRGGSTPSP